MGYITLKWRDELLQWQETDFGGVTRINVAPNEIWAPSLQQISEINVENMYSDAWLSSDGKTAMALAGDLVGHCDVDILYFPLDEQVCQFSLVSSGNDITILNFSLTQNKVDTSSFFKHGVWNVIDSTAFQFKYTEPDINIEVCGLGFSLTLRRRPQFVIIHTMAPLVLIALLNMMIYVVPILSGERISFSVTVLLALIFFTSNIGDNIPQSAVNIPILSMVTASIITLCTINVIISVIFSRIAANKVKPVSGCLKSFVRFIVHAKFSKKGKNAQVQPLEIKNLQSCNKEKPVINDAVCKPSGCEEDFKITWMMVVDVFDMIMFYVHLVVVAASVVLGTLFITDVI